jgi:cell division protein FtsI/penicillin-binding protein 2
MNLNLKKGSRSKILAVIVFSVMVIFVMRLFYLQLVKHDYYVKLAGSTQIKRLEIPSKRGLIYALDGKNPVPLVMNQIVYTVFADPKIAQDDEKIIKIIREVAGGNARPNLEELLAKEDTRYQILATKITRDQADIIKEEGLVGIGFQEETQRVYPEGSLASQVLGFVDHEGVGRYGVESYLNDRLSGIDGLLQSITDVSSVPLTIGDDYIDEPAVDGENIVLSIDSNIQSQVESILKSGIEINDADEGSVIVMNPKNGQVMAMANFPTYDPSKINQIEDISVLNNDVISYTYEPGSVIKTLTLAIGIDKGAISPEDTFINNDYVQIDDRIIRNFVRGKTGEVSFQFALEWSLNTGFVEIAKRLGDGRSIDRKSRDAMYEYYYNRFGLGRKTGIESDGEVSGMIWSPDSAEGNAVRYSNMSFGQGMSLTMIQVASAFCSLVNGGRYYSPTVLSGVIDKNGNYNDANNDEYEQIILEETAMRVRSSINEARRHFLYSGDKPGYYIGGKTGTAEIALDSGGYSKTSTSGTYLGFGGSENETSYVIMVRLLGEDKTFSGNEAMQIFTQISNWMLDYLKIQPKG